MMLNRSCAQKLFSYFSPNHFARPREFWWSVAIAAMMGAIYGSFVAPLWAEASSFGQAWAGFIDYSHSPWGATMFADSSLQITVPALLLQNGMGLWHLNQWLGAFFCASSFAAMTAACFVFTRHGAVSVAMPLLMMTYRLADSHGYPAIFPMNFFQFGQTGQYFCLLAFSVLAAGFPLAAGIIGGALGGIHAVWGACFVLGALPIISWFYPAMLKRLAKGFVVTLALALALQYFGVRSLPSHADYAYQAPAIPAKADSADKKQVENALEKQEKESAAVAAKSGNENAPAKKIRGTFEGHNTLFSDNKSPLQAAIRFFANTFLFFVAAFFALRVMTRDPRYAINLPAARRLIYLIALPLTCISIFKIYEEIDPTYQLLGMIHPQLPVLVIRAIVNRFMNLASFALPIMFISMLFFLIRDRRSFFALIFLVMIVTLGVPYWDLVPYSIIYKKIFLNTVILIAFIAVILGGIEKRYVSASLNQWLSRSFAVLLVLFFGWHIAHYGYIIYQTKPYTGTDNFDAVSAVASKDKGVLIISPEVDGVNNYTPQMRTGRPIMLPTMLSVYDAAPNKIIHLYCYTDPYLPFFQFYADIKPCFEKRTAREWAVIARELPASGIMTPDSWKLTIPVTASSGGFNYYHIPSKGQK